MLTFSGYGYAVEDRGDPATLDDVLRRVADAGFTHAEIDAGLWDVILAGRLEGRALGAWSSVLERHRDHLQYTIHAPVGLNLFDTTNRDLHIRLLKSTVELAAAIGAETIAYHPGTRLPPPVGADEAMTDLMAHEREVLRWIADEVGTWNGRVGIETWFSHGDVGYSYAVWPDQLRAQVDAIAHPAVGVCLDFGHLFLAARWFGFEFLDGVASLAPVVNHFHLQDLFGVLADSESAELGQGDLHLPPGWGSIPFDSVFTHVAFPRSPVLMIELVRGRKIRYLNYLPEMLRECERLEAIAARIASRSTIEVRTSDPNDPERRRS